MYGTNTFEIDIKYDGIRFRYTWLLPSGLRPKLIYPFPNHFLQRNIWRIRHYVINVEHVDSYQGMIKYNCGGPGLTAGVANQVRNFVEEVKNVESFGRVAIRLTDGDINRVLSDLRRVKVHCVERERKKEVTETVLNAFQNMKDVRRVEIFGSVSQEYAIKLEQAMTGPRACAVVGEAPHAVNSEDVNIDLAVLWRWKHAWNA